LPIALACACFILNTEDSSIFLACSGLSDPVATVVVESRSGTLGKTERGHAMTLLDRIQELLDEERRDAASEVATPGARSGSDDLARFELRIVASVRDAVARETARLHADEIGLRMLLQAEGGNFTDRLNSLLERIARMDARVAGIEDAVNLRLPARRTG
jgi:hypothetical protein